VKPGWHRCFAITLPPIGYRNTEDLFEQWCGVVFWRVGCRNLIYCVDETHVSLPANGGSYDLSGVRRDGLGSKFLVVQSERSMGTHWGRTAITGNVL